jgi:hypothetical protein
LAKARARAKVKAKIKAEGKAKPLPPLMARAKVRAKARIKGKAPSLPKEKEHPKEYHLAVHKPMLDRTHQPLSVISVTP